MATSSGVYPCYENQFQINTSTTSTATWASIADCESFDVTFDNGIQEWYPFSEEGWVRRLQTAKSISISVSGKRHIGDTGNDFVANLAWDKNGRDVEKGFKWTFPDGGSLTFDNAVISVTACGAGASTDVAPLEFEILSNGKPTYDDGQ